jgi:hypothetical protein
MVPGEKKSCPVVKIETLIHLRKKKVINLAAAPHWGRCAVIILFHFTLLRLQFNN